MTASELTKEIYDKYPNVWEKIKDYFCIENKKITDNYYELYILKNQILLYFKGNGFYMPLSMLYGLLDDFFEDNAISISIDNAYRYKPIIKYLKYKNNKPNFYDFTVVNPENCAFYGSKNEAKIAAILKACEIMEERL